MANDYRARLVGVFGCPVDENPTIVMQEAAFAERGLHWRYLTLLVKPEDLQAAFLGMRAMNFDGINLTIPHKKEAMKYVDELTDGAKLIGAINTVVNKNGRLVGENTDGRGFVVGMQVNGINLIGKHLVVLGAGGASRAICVECALAGCASITIINRSLHKAGEIAQLINENTACKASFLKWEGTARIPSCDILINATSIGLYPDESKPDICYEDIKAGLIVQDIIPNPAFTAFLYAAKQRGAQVFDGLNMLVYQGAIGFKLWTGEEAPIEVMKHALENENT